MEKTDFERVRTAAIAQFAMLAERVTTLDESALELPTRLDGWRVAELVAHLARNWDAVRSGLEKPGPAQAEVGLVEYYDGAQAVAPAVRQRSIDDVAAISQASLRQHFCDIVENVSGRLAGELHDRLIVARLGSLHLGDFLVTRCVEGVVHGLDLAHAVSATPADFVHQAAVRECLALLIARAPARYRGELSGNAAATALIEHLTGRAPRSDLDPRFLAIPPVLC